MGVSREENCAGALGRDVWSTCSTVSSSVGCDGSAAVRTRARSWDSLIPAGITDQGRTGV